MLCVLIFRRLLHPTTFLPGKGGGTPLSAFSKNATNKLAGFSSHYYFCVERQTEKLQIPFLKLMVYFEKGIKPRSTDFDADIAIPATLQEVNYGGEQKYEIYWMTF